MFCRCIFEFERVRWRAGYRYTCFKTDRDLSEMRLTPHGTSLLLFFSGRVYKTSWTHSKVSLEKFQINWFVNETSAHEVDFVSRYEAIKLAFACCLVYVSKLKCFNGCIDPNVDDSAPDHKLNFRSFETNQFRKIKLDWTRLSLKSPAALWLSPNVSFMVSK